MQVLVLSIVVALLVLLLLLGVFGVFTRTPLAHRIEEGDRKRHQWHC